MQTSKFSRRLVRTVGKHRAKKIVKPLKTKQGRMVVKAAGALFFITTVAKIVALGGALLWGYFALT